MMAFDPDKYLAEKTVSTGFDPDAYLQEKSAPTVTPQSMTRTQLPQDEGSTLGGIGQAALGGVALIGEQADRFLGAPVRSAVGEVLRRREERGGRAPGLAKFVDPAEYGDIAAAAKTVATQFGKDPRQAPTGQQLAERMGTPRVPISEFIPSLYSATGEGLALKRGGMLDPTLSGIQGLGIDMAADLSNVVPGKAITTPLKVAGKGIGKGTSIGATVAAKGVDLATGTRVGTGALNVTKAAIKGTAEAAENLARGLKAQYGAKQAADFPRMKTVAERNGIDTKLLPAAVEFGPTHSTTYAARVQAETPAGQILRENHEAGLSQVRDAIERDIERIGLQDPDLKGLKNRAVPPIPATQADAGDLIRQGYDEGFDRLMGDMEVTHNKIIKENPNLFVDEKSLNKLTQDMGFIQRFAEKRAQNGITKAQKEQGAQLLEALNTIQRNSLTYEGLVSSLRDIGEIAFKQKNIMADIPPDVQRFRQLYGHLNEALTGTVKNNLGADKAKALLENNKAISEMYGDKSLLAQLGDNTKDPEKLFQSLILNGGSKRIEALRKYLTPEQMAVLKARYLKEMLKPNPQGEFGFRTVWNGLRNRNETVQALFDKSELDNLKELLELGDKFGPAVMSTSGTGASNAFGRLTEEIKRAPDYAAASVVKDRARKAAQAPKKPGMSSPGGPAASLDGSATLKKLVGVNRPRTTLSRLYSIQAQEEE